MEIKGSGIRPPKKGYPGHIQRFLVYELQKTGLLIKHRFLWKNRRSFCNPSFQKGENRETDTKITQKTNREEIIPKGKESIKKRFGGK